MVKSTIFLTGATGLLGSYLLKILLQNKHKVYCLARSKDNRTARERVIDILNFWDEKVLAKYSDNLIVIEGDITEDDLGIDEKARKLLKGEVEEIFHCGAITKFNLPLEKIREVNVGGTENVLELALQCRNLKKVNHISTAYVCGNYRGVFKEDDLEVGQGFLTTYEQSKFEAEKLVLDYREKGLWIDIFRPVWIAGESHTGKTFVFQHLYQLLHILSSEIFDVIPGDGVFLNITPVDILSRCILKVSSEVSLKNKTYHPFPDKAVSFSRIIDIASNFIGFRRPCLVSFDKFDINSYSPVQKMILRNSLFFINPYVKLNSSNSNRVFEEIGFRFSEFKKENLLVLLKYLIKTNFLKSNKEWVRCISTK